MENKIENKEEEDDIFRKIEKMKPSEKKGKVGERNWKVENRIYKSKRFYEYTECTL